MKVDLLERLRLELPVLQAPLGGGISSPQLAAAVSNAGGLGTIGFRSPGAMRRDFALARALAPHKPLGMGLLLPFTLRVHVDAVIAAKPEAVVLMAGFAPRVVERLRSAGIAVLHQVGSLEHARRALRDRADGLIAQGVEAGGHVLGEQAGTALLPNLLAIADGKPVLLAGGIASRDDVKAALGAGAAGVVAGTRYLLTHEALAHPAYKQRALGARRTLLTRLFGVGWSLKHRVAPNAATERFCDERGGIAPWARLLQSTTEPLLRRFAGLSDRSGPLLRNFNGLPLFLALPPRPDQPASAIEYAPLYAGESAARIHTLESAFEVTQRFGSG